MKYALLALISLLLPGIASAGVIMPPGGTDWDLYVYGNGRVIFDLLNSIKMLMVPTAGSTGFTTLLLVLALIGFFVLAVSAAFDPAKNFLKMFTYILVVWFITYGSTSLTANVVIIDMVKNNDTLGLEPIYRIDGVPALVALPAALTSQVGRYFTTAVETYFSMPGELKMSGQAVGQFNLFGRMMKESTQYVITSPELKRSISQYVADCTIPAMALGKLTSSVPTGKPDGSTEVVSGTTALLRSTDLMETLGTARNKSILTKYYPFNKSDPYWFHEGSFETFDMTYNGDNTPYMSTGVLLSCDTAYRVIYHDMQLHAQDLLDGTADAWAKAGVMVPFQGAMQTMLAESAMTGTNRQPSGFIMQTAFINSMNGSFRQAAIQTGNNSAITAAQLAQAEQSQWSAWSAGFTTFNNTMGYVYTVLQAFIFAITPFIIVALFIPGMGKAIFVNYAQILVWMTLWSPLLAIVNYLITLFATDSVGGIVYMDGGPSLQNKAILTESVNHTMIAAQFLGTMVPLISWGIVKGAMAFTDFITQGIGNQFAAQAGAGAATGNLSMNNMSMDNASMNKFSTMSSSQVGHQAVQAGVNAGALQATHDLGGQDARMNGSAASLKHAAQSALQQGISESQQVTEQLQHMASSQMSASELMSKAASSNSNVAEQRAAQMVISNMLANSTSEDGSLSQDAALVKGWQTQQSAANSGSRKESIEVGAKLPSAFVSGGASMGTENTNQFASQDAASGGANTSNGAKVGTSASLTENNSQAVSDALSRMIGVSTDSSAKVDLSKSHSFTEAVSESTAQSESITKTLQASKSVTESMDFAGGVGAQGVTDMMSSIQSMNAGMGGGVGAMQSTMSNHLQSLGASSAQLEAAGGVFQSQAGGSLASMSAASTTPGASINPTRDMNTGGFQATQDRARAGVDNVRQTVDSRNDKVTDTNASIIDRSNDGRSKTGAGAVWNGVKGLGSSK